MFHDNDVLYMMYVEVILLLRSRVYKYYSQFCEFIRIIIILTLELLLFMKGIRVYGGTRGKEKLLIPAEPLTSKLKNTFLQRSGSACGWFYCSRSAYDCHRLVSRKESNRQEG